MDTNLWHVLFEILPVPIMILSQDGRVTKANQCAKTMLETNNNQLVNKHFTEVFPDSAWQVGDDSGTWPSTITVNVDKRPHLAQLVHFDTTDLPYHYILTIKTQENPLESLLPDEAQSIFESSNDGIFITDGQGYVLMVNSSYERITGNPKSEVVGRHVKDLMEAGYFSESASLEILKTKKKVTVIPKLRNNRDVMVTGSPVFDKNGSIIMVVINVRDMSELKALQAELQRARALEETYRGKNKSYADMVVNSPLMQDVLSQAKQIAPFPTSVLISGETGVGKEVIADFIQQNSDRASKPYLKINCGSIPENLLESEMYGYEPGAFTGASKYGKTGIIELANEGTLLLDEIGELPLNLQVKLLRFLQDQKIVKIGGTRAKVIDVRIISSTNRDLEEMIKQNRFRSDLYYRLNVIHIKVPPLRERVEDIIPLAQFFLSRYCSRFNLSKSFSEEILACFMDYDWPGNIRELRNLVENLTVSSRDCILDPLHLPNTMLASVERQFDGAGLGSSLKDILERTERRFIVSALQMHRGIRSAARSLHLDHATLLRKMRRYGIEQRN